MWDQRLSLKLIHEIKNLSTIPSTTTPSPPTTNIINKQAWIDQLPTSFNTPLHWNNNILIETQYNSMINRVYNQRESWDIFYDNWLSVTDEKYKSIVSKSDVYLALECCNRYVLLYTLLYTVLYVLYIHYRTHISVRCILVYNCCIHIY